mgnify:FL=1
MRLWVTYMYMYVIYNQETQWQFLVFNSDDKIDDKSQKSYTHKISNSKNYNAPER